MFYEKQTNRSRVRNIAIACAIIGGFAGASPALAISCSGGACGDVDLKWDGSCYSVKNYGSDRVRVQIGSGGLGTVKMTLRGGQSITIKNPFGGGCRNSLGGKMRANYI